MSATEPVGAPAPHRSTSPIRGVPVGTWAGVPVRAHWSVLLMLALVTDILGASALPDADPGQPRWQYWLFGAITAVLFVGSVVAHELGHVVAARRSGVRVNGLVVWALGGMTELDGEPPTPKADITVALAGPAVTLAVGVLSFVLAAAVPIAVLQSALVWLGAMSVLLFVFNLLPAAPLDGGAVLRGLLWRHSGDRARAVAVEARAGRVLGIVLIALGVLELVAGDALGLWLVIIGWFVIGAAATADNVASSDVARLHASDVMIPAHVVAADWWTVPQLLSALTGDALAQELYPLVSFGGEVTGMVDLADLGRVRASQRDGTRLSTVARRPLLLRDDATLGDFAVDLRMHGNRAVVVDDARRPIGVVTGHALVRAIRLGKLGWGTAGTPAGTSR